MGMGAGSVQLGWLIPDPKPLSRLGEGFQSQSQFTPISIHPNLNSPQSQFTMGCLGTGIRERPPKPIHHPTTNSQKKGTAAKATVPSQVSSKVIQAIVYTGVMLAITPPCLWMR